jgi:hypothetical protein
MAKKKKGGFLKKIFKRKVGGTMVGNLLRKVSNQMSGGVLGNGMMKLQAGETVAESNDRIADRLSNVVAAGVVADKTTGFIDEVQSKIKQGGSKMFLWIGGIALALIAFLFVRKK